MKTKITYDKEADAQYIQLKSGAVHQTKEMGKDLFFDFDEKGSLMGVEILGVSKYKIA